MSGNRLPNIELAEPPGIPTVTIPPGFSGRKGLRGVVAVIYAVDKVRLPIRVNTKTGVRSVTHETDRSTVRAFWERKSGNTRITMTQPAENPRLYAGLSALAIPNGASAFAIRISGSDISSRLPRWEQFLMDPGGGGTDYSETLRQLAQFDVRQSKDPAATWLAHKAAEEQVPGYLVQNIGDDMTTPGRILVLRRPGAMMPELAHVAVRALQEVVDMSPGYGPVGAEWADRAVAEALGVNRLQSLDDAWQRAESSLSRTAGAIAVVQSLSGI